MARQWIEQGETIRLYALYNDIETGEMVDPLALSCEVRLPDGSVNTITYPHTDLVKESQGNFFVRVAGTQVGTYNYVIRAQITLVDFDVRAGKFDVEAV